MSVTFQDVLRALAPEEVDYTAAEALGPEAIPHLERLAQGPDVLLASKAVYLAGRIDPEAAAPVLDTAASSPEPRLRIAAATALRQVPEETAAPIVDRLLTDADVGVRKLAVGTASGMESAEMTDRVRGIAEEDSDPGLRRIARHALGE